MSVKHALFGVAQTGGAKAGVCIPDGASDYERRRILQAFGRAIGAELRSRRYIPWTDMGCSAGDVRAVLEAAGAPTYPIDDSALATAWSVFGSVLGAADALGLDVRQCTAAIEGFGRVGKALARELENVGCKVVAASTGNDSARKKIEVLESDATFLIPAARPESITTGTNVRAKVIVPAANAPYAAVAVEHHSARGVLCLSDVVCNAGGGIGTRMVRYGLSAAEARQLVVSQWRGIARRMVSQGARLGITQEELVRRMLLSRRKNSLFSRAFEHLLRSQVIPRWARRHMGLRYAQSRFEQLQRKIPA
jgi:glutamate dehydrogenase/leucine dehydrogenase